MERGADKETTRGPKDMKLVFLKKKGFGKRVKKGKGDIKTRKFPAVEPAHRAA